jgi:hypothetical protein
VQDSFKTPARSYAKGIGTAIADRTYNRLVSDTQGGVERRETWAEVANRVAMGNALLNGADCHQEFHKLHHHLRQASTLMSGRHLQHGDMGQPNRNQEVFTNCSTSATTFLSFYLLMNGSGVGRSYDDAMMKVDYNHLPYVVPVCDAKHPDILSGEVQCGTYGEAKHDHWHRKQHYFRVPDSREGWAKAIEKIEVLAFYKAMRDDVLIIDFSDVRERGRPIKGMQNRPASGPAPLIAAIQKIAKLRDMGYAPWKAAMFADHYASECVLVGGARRSARMSTKTWRDESVLEFISIKQGGDLWSSNNSVTVDADFWRYVREVDSHITFLYDPLRLHARKVFMAICEASYKHGTGEPGIINQHLLTQNDEGMEQVYGHGDYAESERYQLDFESKGLMIALGTAYKASPLKMITNPCGEVTLSMMGGYCVIADVVPYHAQSDADAEDAFRTVTRALIRVNKMDSLYSKEVKRTNRIGVGMTGLHEYAWARFGFDWRQLVDEEASKPFWLMLSRFKRAVQSEAAAYSAKLGMVVPHTDTTMKPSGTISKLFGLTEGAHLPSMREYIRWVQFRHDDPLIAEYAAKGYPVRELQTYKGHTIVGFPTQPAICQLGMGDRLVTAAEATPTDQFEWLMLLEKYWITGVEEDGVTPLRETGNQVSYTLKYFPEAVSFEKFVKVIKANQPHVRCCSVMPQTNATAYEYTPEEGCNKAEFDAISQAIIDEMEEDVGLEHVDCAGGACPIDFRQQDAA